MYFALIIFCINGSLRVSIIIEISIKINKFFDYNRNYVYGDFIKGILAPPVAPAPPASSVQTPETQGAAAPVSVPQPENPAQPEDAD